MGTFPSEPDDEKFEELPHSFFGGLYPGNRPENRAAFLKTKPEAEAGRAPIAACIR